MSLSYRYALVINSILACLPKVVVHTYHAPLAPLVQLSSSRMQEGMGCKALKIVLPQLKMINAPYRLGRLMALRSDRVLLGSKRRRCCST